jgi:outer membrane receptor protein involved in Fe transport
VHNRVIQSSSQFRNELNLVYQRGTTLSAVGGVEIRDGSIQRDYSRTTNCEPRDWLADRGLANVRDDQLLEETRESLLDVLLFERIFFLLDPRARPFVTPCLRADSDGDAHPLAPDLPDQVAGEHFAVRDIGVFAQASYRPARQLKLIGGWRLDNNRISPNGGFGTVFSPRLGVVYSPAGLVLRATYSEAFQDASSFEKFSTVPGLRDKANPALQPERAKNFELSAGRQWGRLSADLAVYRATYSSTVGLQPTNLADDPDVGTFIQALHGLGIRNIGDWLDLYFDEDPLKGDRTLRQVLADRAPEAIAKIFKDPLLTFQFQNGGTLRVWGVQSTASWRYGSLDLFGNYTYTNPMNMSRPDAAGSLLSVRVGDIATHQANVGVNAPVGRLNTNVRLNYVGGRPTGKGTSVDRNPLSEIESYAVAHATLSYTLRPGLTAQVIVNNLFDTEYFDPGVGPADGAHFAASIPQPRRAAFVRLLTSF